MKKSGLIAVTLLIVVSSLQAQTADQWVTQGRSLLVSSNFAGAYTDFTTQLGLSPTNGPANVLAAATRLLILPQQTAGSNFLNRLGFPAAGRNLLNWTATFPKDGSGNTILPSNFNSTEVIALYSNAIMPVITASLANLAQITDQTFTLDLTADETHVTAVTLDYGDIMMLQALLHAGDFLGHTMNAHNFSVVMNHLKDLGSAIPASSPFKKCCPTIPASLIETAKPISPLRRPLLRTPLCAILAASDFIRNVRRLAWTAFRARARRSGKRSQLPRRRDQSVGFGVSTRGHQHQQ